MTNGIAGNLSGLLQPFNEQSPINLIAMISQLGQQNPAALAALLAKTGAQPPPVPPLAGGPLPIGPTSPIAGGGGVGALIGAGPTPLGGGAGGLGAPAAPISAPAPAPAIPEGGGDPGRLERVLKAVSQLETPPAPEIPRAPAAQLPRLGGPAPNPELLAQLFQLLQGGQPQGIPTLGQLIAGKSGVPAAPTVQF